MSSTSLSEWLGKLGLGKELSSADILSGLAVNTAISKIVPKYTVRVSPNTTPSARINNWSIVVSELEKVGIHIGQQERTKILNGDQKAVYAILQQIKNYYDRHREEADLDVSKIDSRGDPKTARSLLELFVLVIIRYYGFSVKQAVALLSNDSKYLAHILAKGFKEQSRPVELMMEQFQQLLPQIVTFCKVKENEVFFLKSIKPGLISRFLGVSELALHLLTAFALRTPDPYEILKNELIGTLLLCLRRHSCMLPSIVKAITQMTSHNKNLLSLLMSNAGAGEVDVLMIEMVSQMEQQGRAYEVFQQFRIQEFIQACIQQIKNADRFVDAATFLIKTIEHSYQRFTSDPQNSSRLLESLSSLSLSRKVDSIVFCNLLFGMLQQLGRKKHPLAPQLLNLAVERYRNSNNQEDSHNYIYNFLEIVDYFPSMPTTAIAETILACYDSNTTLIRQLQFSFLLNAIETANEKLAVRMLGTVTKVFVEEVGCVENVVAMVQAILKKLDSKPIFDLAVKFVKVCLSVHYSNLRKLIPPKSSTEGVLKLDKSNVAFKLKNLEVQKLVAAIVALPNEKLRKAVEPLICYSFFQAELKSRQESQGLKRVMLALGSQDDLRKLYQNDAKMMLEEGAEGRKKSQGRQKKKGDREKIEKEGERMRVNSDASLLTRKRNLFSTLNPPLLPPDVQKGIEKFSKHFLEKVGKLSLEEEKKAQQEERRELLKRKMTVRMVQQGINTTAGRELPVNYLFEFNSRQRPPGSDFSYLPFYDQTVEDERDVKGVQFFFKRYGRLFKLYYTHYASIRPSNIKLFDDISERGGLMQSANAWKLLRDHGLDQFITVNEVQYLVQRINGHFKKEYRDSSLLDQQAFQNFIIQAALTMFSRPPKDLRSRPISEMLQELVNRFRQHAQQNKIDEKLFEDDQPPAHSEELRQLNQKLKQNPDYILPEGYRKHTTKRLVFDYKLHLHAFDQSYAEVFEVLDQIISERLGFHLLEPYSVTSTIAIARPLLYQHPDNTTRERSLSSIFPRNKDGQEALQSNLSRVENKFSKEKRLKEEEKQMREAEEARRREQRDRQVKALLEKHRERQLEIDRKKEEQRAEEARKAEEERKRKEKYEEDLKRKLIEYAEKKRIDRQREEQQAKRKKEQDAKNAEKMKADLDRKRKLIEEAREKKRQQENARIQKEAAEIKKREEENRLKLIERKEKTIKMLQNYSQKKHRQREESEEKAQQSQFHIELTPSRLKLKSSVNSTKKLPTERDSTPAKRPNTPVKQSTTPGRQDTPPSSTSGRKAGMPVPP